MIKLSYSRNLLFLILFIIIPLQYFVFADDSFIDNKGEQIYFKSIEKNAYVDEEKEAFFLSFEDNYKNISPQELKSTFKNFSDVQKWLKETFDEEMNNFKNNSKVYLITARTRKKDKTIGAAIFQLSDNPNHKIIHIRQLAILPEYQARGIGTKLLFSIKNLIPDLDLMIVDARKVNVKAYQFYDKHGFSLANSPNDETLDPNKYNGFFLKLSNSYN